ncbi:MAG TPA: Mur ligase domain-containing protein [Patescibacteria group bacterium]|nr:Mur ligase domain-containing protein [Patescibacteria group bacterium]
MRYFLIGIGGISMSAIAKYLILRGEQVSGSDIRENNEIKNLEKMGANIVIGQKPANITNNIDEVIFTSAITPNSVGHTELQRAKKMKIPTYKRSVFLGKLISDNFGITVSGMHGKTTTTAMLGFVLKKLNQNPTVFVGGEFRPFSNSNLEFNKKSKYFITEGCEYDRSFLDFQNLAAIILNIEPEHLDYFQGGLPEILKTFRIFLSKIPKTGFAVLCWDNENVRKMANSAKCEIIKYSKKDLSKYNLHLQIPGEHNLMNALAVIKVVEKLGLSVSEAEKILSEFPGVGRRFEHLGKIGKTDFIDDYAHHPTEIAATLKVVEQKYSGKKVLVIFQPHQYSRTRLLFDDFVKIFSGVENLAIMSVYEVVGREEDKSVGVQELAGAISKSSARKIQVFRDQKEVLKYLVQNYQKYDLVVTMGAGILDLVAKKFIAQHQI